jgi:hypothetical protein
VGNIYTRDNARSQIGARTGVLQRISDETVAGQFRNKDEIFQAITIWDEGMVTSEPPGGDRRTIPQTITFHPLWINLVRGHAFNLLTPQKLQDATKGMSNQLFKMKGSTSMDSLISLEGTIQHEVCQKKHLLSLGFAHKISVFI